VKPTSSSEPQRQQKRLLQEFTAPVDTHAPQLARRSKPAQKTAARGNADWSEF
jgi:hypothetical protein